MLYTRKGDSGTSGLFGTKERFPKDHPIFDALGSVDELNSLIGLCRAYVRDHGHGYIADDLYRVQETLFIVQAELAGSEKRITQAQVDALEEVIGNIEAVIEPPTSFLVPGATCASAFLDYVRTVARRVERSVLRTAIDSELSPELRAYLNRLSSFFYVLARQAAQGDHVVEQAPTYDVTP